MNELEFKRHLKEMVHGRHHPEEHDWDSPGVPKKAPRRASSVKRRPPHKGPKKK